MGPRPLTLVSAGVAVLAFIFVISLHSGWFGNSVTIAGLDTVKTTFGTRGFCASFSFITSCASYSELISQAKNGPAESEHMFKQLALAGNIALALTVLSFMLTLFSIIWTSMRGFDLHASCRGWLPAFVTMLISALLMLIAAVEFIGMVKHLESENPSQPSQAGIEVEIEKMTPGYAFYLALVSMLVNVAAAVVLFVDRKELVYQNMGDTVSLNSDNYQ